ncbi:MAG: DUF4864 domain-containing protein [Methylobacterium sp.]|nr:DUF4864 domain-containing protein [Methylobacterium sp.]
MRAAILVLMLALSPSLASEGVDRDAARAVIARQQEAFRRDDAAAAYAEAAPAIKELFGSPDRFVGMVREGYAPVYRNRSFAFDGDEELAGGGLAQRVRIQDLDGTDWIALYTLEREPDGSWKITGCRLLKAPGVTA